MSGSMEWVDDDTALVPQFFLENSLALQKRYTRIIKWLEKRIEVNEKRLKWQNKNLDKPFGIQIADGLEQRIADYKEILAKMKEDD